ncbi:hypothetical protein SACC_23320 [Saccharolobus caldissimus]|uniref:Uncharacterized protein n=1 Tax=Saccharolobus caldissimus TaxID=1702097 RepID=A0AAQ4CU34_9CREN|nr:hypothetical protein SACC_23320 [Saccharolobus caldissimus]
MVYYSTVNLSFDISIPATGGLYLYSPLFGLFAQLLVWRRAKLPDGLQAQGSQRPTPQSDLYYTDLTNMFYIRSQFPDEELWKK